MKRTPAYLRTLLAFLALLTPGAVTAAVLVVASADAPTSYYVSSTATAGGLQWRNDTTNGRRDVGQSFYAGQNLLLDSITFQVSSNASAGVGAVNAAFTLSVYELNSATAFPTAGTAISTQTGTLTGIDHSTADFSKYLTFDMENVSLTAGKYYAVMLTFDSQVAQENITWQVSNTGASYADGQCIITTNGTTFSANNDLVFYVTAVPEPGSLTLFGFGLLASLPLWRKIRRNGR